MRGSARIAPPATNAELWRVEKALLQRFTDGILYRQVDEIERDTLEFLQLVDEVFEPDGPQILCNVLLCVKTIVVRRLHQGLPADDCGNLPREWVEDVFALQPPPVADLFRTWFEGIFAGYRSRHPESPAEQAAAAIRARPMEPWRSDTLADLVRVRSRALSDDFRAVFGMRSKQYVHNVRVLHALDSLADPVTKIEALSALLGYRSRKGLYAWTSALLGAKPGELRSLADQARGALRKQMVNRSLPVRLRQPTYRREAH